MLKAHVGRARAPRGLGTGADPDLRASHSVRRTDACDDDAVRRTVLIVDDHEEFRTSARALLEAEGFAVVGEAADGVGAIEAVATLRPTVVLLDVQLPGADGIAVAEGISAGPDPPAVVLISSRAAAAYGPRLGRTPARGFIAKSELSGAVLADLLH
jgi:DNA-binding NarL/FixJ family response regulator